MSNAEHERWLKSFQTLPDAYNALMRAARNIVSARIGTNAFMEADLLGRPPFGDTISWLRQEERKLRFGEKTAHQLEQETKQHIKRFIELAIKRGDIERIAPTKKRPDLNGYKFTEPLTETPFTVQKAKSGKRKTIRDDIDDDDDEEDDDDELT